MSEIYELVIKLKPLHKSITSTQIFKLNTVFTPYLIAIFWTFLTCKEYFLSPIECTLSNVMGSGDKDLQKFMNTWCWISSTYTVSENFKNQYQFAPYPGILPNTNISALNPPKFYNYYQYVVYALMAQALLFLWIGYIWKCWENNFMLQLTKDSKRYTISKDEIKEEVTHFVDYFLRSLNFHNIYVFKYWFCELLCVLNVLLQMILLDWFFNGDFTNFGIEVLNLLEQQPQERIDSISLVFPRMTKCTFRKYGQSGSIETRDALCVLGQNNYNEKVYVFIWFWYWILLIFSGAVLIFRIALISSSRIRINVLGSRDFSIPEPVVRKVAELGSIGDWWLIYMLALNVDGRVFKDLMQKLSDKTTKIVPVKESDDCELQIRTFDDDDEGV